MDVDIYNKLNSNINKYYLMKFFSLFLLSGSMITFFVLTKGYSMFQYSLYVSISLIASMFLELPSGLFADVFGRKKSLMIYSVGFFFWILFLYFSDNFIILVLSGIFGGARLSFFSGSESALLYDSLKQINKKDEYPKVIGKSHSYFLVGMGISSILGSIFINFVSLDQLILLTLSTPIILFLIIMSMYEPKSEHNEKNKSFVKHIYEIIILFKSNNKLIILTLFFSIVNQLFIFIFLYLQPFFKNYLQHLSLFGYYYAIFLIFSTFSSYYYGKISKNVGDLKLLRVISIVLIGGLILQGVNNFYFYFIIICIIEIFYGIMNPTMNHFINKEISSKYRASLLSVKGFFGSIFSIIFFPLGAYIGDNIGIQNMMMVIGIIMGIILVTLLNSLKYHYSDK